VRRRIEGPHRRGCGCDGAIFYDRVTEATVSSRVQLYAGGREGFYSLRRVRGRERDGKTVIAVLACFVSCWI